MGDVVNRLRETARYAELFTPHITIEVCSAGLRIRGRVASAIGVRQYDHVASLEELEMGKVNTLIPAIDRVAASLQLVPARQ